MENALRSFRRHGVAVTVRRPYAIWLSVGIALLFVILVLAYPDLMRRFAHQSPIEDPAIPTSFSGNRIAYGFALFSLFTMSSLAFRQLILIAWHLREEDWRADPDVGLYRMVVGCMMMVILLGAGPDVILLLLWGEAGDRSMTTAMTFDRICDGLAILPFVAAVFLRLRAEQFQRTPHLADLQRLAPHIDFGPRERRLFLVRPKPESVWENVKIVSFVMAIAVGLALWK